MAKGKKKGLSAARVAAMDLLKQAEDLGNADEKALARASLKALKFKEIVVPRVNRAIAQLKSIGKLANRSAYAWDHEQADKIVEAINAAAMSTIDRFTEADKNKGAFSL
jgi:hypothetical protein